MGFCRRGFRLYGGLVSEIRFIKGDVALSRSKGLPKGRRVTVRLFTISSTLNLIILLIPSDKPRYPLLDGRPGPESGITDQIVNIRIRFGDVSGLQRQKLFLSLPAEAFFDHADKIKQSDRIVKPRILLLQ